MCVWDKRPIDVLSVERVLQEITQGYVSQEATKPANDSWLTTYACSLISLTPVCRLLIKSAWGASITKISPATPGKRRFYSYLIFYFTFSYYVSAAGGFPPIMEGGQLCLKLRTVLNTGMSVKRQGCAEQILRRTNILKAPKASPLSQHYDY